MKKNIEITDPVHLYKFGPLKKGERFYMGTELEVELGMGEYLDDTGFYEEGCPDMDCKMCNDGYFSKCPNAPNEGNLPIAKLADIFEGFACFKEDGTIDDGREIVSMPSGFKHQKEGWIRCMERFRKSMPKYYQHARRRSGTHCGTHIHISQKFRERPGLSEDDIFRMVRLVFNPANKERMERLARRKDNSYSSLRAIKGSYTDYYYSTPRYITELEEITPETVRNLGRAAVNPYSHHHTTEIRMFKSSPTPWSIARAIEAAHSLASYAMDEDNPEYKTYAKYVTKHADLYPILVRTV